MAWCFSSHPLATSPSHLFRGNGGYKGKAQSKAAALPPAGFDDLARQYNQRTKAIFGNQALVHLRAHHPTPGTIPPLVKIDVGQAGSH